MSNVSVAAGVLTGRARTSHPTTVMIEPETLDLSGIHEKLDREAIINQLRPQIEARVLAIMAELMADWEMRAKAKAPMRKQRVKPGARGRKIQLRGAREFSDYTSRKGSPTRTRISDIIGIHEHKGMPTHRHTSAIIANVSRSGSILGALKFTKEAGFLAGRSPALVARTKRGGLRGFTKGQLTGVAGGTLKESIKVESIDLVAAAAPAVAAARGVLVATAPYAAPVHEGRRTGKHGKVGRRPFMTAAAKEVEANLQQGRYTGRG